MKFLGKRDSVLLIELTELEAAAMLSGMRETLEVWDEEYGTRTGFSNDEFDRLAKDFSNLLRDAK